MPIYVTIRNTNVKVSYGEEEREFKFPNSYKTHNEKLYEVKKIISCIEGFNEKSIWFITYGLYSNFVAGMIAGNLKFYFDVNK